MKQYRITSEHFVLPGETGEADAVMNADDLHELKKLAGLVTEGGPGVISGIAATPQASEEGILSAVGSNITTTAAHRNALLDKYHARPGSRLWFLINFEPVRGMGANTGTLEDKIKALIKQHPDEDPKNYPRLRDPR